MLLEWLRRGLGGSAGLASAVGVVESVFAPSAAEARHFREREHERVIPVPSPGDRMLDEGVVVLRLGTRGGRSEEADPGAATSPP